MSEVAEEKLSEQEIRECFRSIPLGLRLFLELLCTQKDTLSDSKANSHATNQVYLFLLPVIHSLLAKNVRERKAFI